MAVSLLLTPHAHAAEASVADGTFATTLLIFAAIADSQLVGRQARAADRLRELVRSG